MTGTIMSQMAAMQIGNGSDTLGGAGSPVSKLLAVLSIAAFVLMGGPEQVVGATINTFVAVPVGTPLQTAGLIDLMIELLRQSFLLTLRGVAPAVAAIMVSTFAIGLISRNYPQIVGITVYAWRLRMAVCGRFQTSRHDHPRSDRRQRW